MQQGHNCNPGQKKSRASQEYQRGQFGGKYSKFVSRGGRQHRFTCPKDRDIGDLLFNIPSGRRAMAEEGNEFFFVWHVPVLPISRWKKGWCPPDGVKRCPQGKLPKLQI
ncbi:hypothetical protein CEXT_32611 [Caerostris extrusa]|uniref:Uncharacterized protein n=1 Tax=Caerostris extrusa TaxID=172846 RepID=A0AAV4SPP6_CAEEX|nr:hypothetical protein CEXT_32611 [Caerostris extrusa]